MISMESGITSSHRKESARNLLTIPKEVFIRQDSETGDVILSRKPATWDDFFVALKSANVSADFLNEKERNQGTQDRDPFEGYGK